MIDLRGLSFTVAIGKYGGFHPQISRNYIGITLGWISFMIWFLDVEALMSSLIGDAIKYRESQELEE